jgi:hypothetical protein
VHRNAAEWIVLSVLLAGSGWGCAAGAGATPSLIPVKGQVTYKGQPLTKGEIKFEPDGGYGRRAKGELRSDGTFVLTTDKEGDGVVAGHHQVFITGTGSHPAKEVVPKKYTLRASSTLTADVDATHTEFHFDLK